MGDEYYLDTGGKTEGPFGRAHLEAELDAGRISPETLCAEPGGERWVPVGEVLGHTPPVVCSSTVPVAQVQLAPMQLSAAGQSLGAAMTDVDVQTLGADRGGLKYVRSKTTGLLTPRETILGIAAQWLPGISYDGVVLTTRRIILVYPSLAGLRLVFRDWLWIDVLNVRIAEAVLGTTYFVEAAGGGAQVERLHKAEARAMYRLGQEIAQAARAGRWQYEMQSLEAGSAVLRR